MKLLQKLMRPRNTVLLEMAGVLPQRRQKKTDGTANEGSPVRYTPRVRQMDTRLQP